MEQNEGLTPKTIYEMIAELGFRKYFHFGGFKATQELISLIPFDDTKSVLEVGCASGKTSCYLARSYGCQVTGIDMLPGMVDRANERARREGVTELVKFRVGDAQALTFGTDSFDIVMGEFITGLLPDKRKGVKEYSRVAKPGGVIGFNEGTWIKSPPPDGLTDYLRNTVGFQGDILTPGEWQSTFEEAGIVDLAIQAHQVETLKNPKDDMTDMLRALPKVLSMYFSNPLFRKFIKVSLTLPKTLLDYFGYGLYVGKNG
jgi:SAM-dependent methyltransferase